MALLLPRRHTAWVLRARFALVCAVAALALWGGLPGAPAYAQALQDIPLLTGHVIDRSATLEAAQLQVLDDKLTAFERESGAQVVVLLVASTQPEDIAAYANRVGNAWKIGRKGIGDGLLLIVAKNDRRVRIEVAKSLEGAIPDLAAKQIIDEAITPHFRVGDYAGGLDGAATLIMARIKGEALPAPATQRTTGRPGFQWMDLAVFLFFAVPMMGAAARRMFGKPLGSIVTGGGIGVLAFLLTSSLLVAGLAGLAALLFNLLAGAGRMGSGSPSGIGHSHWGSGTSSGSSSGGFGGFSSGGGGDFGGGGASGDW